MVMLVQLNSKSHNNGNPNERFKASYRGYKRKAEVGRIWVDTCIPALFMMVMAKQPCRSPQLYEVHPYIGHAVITTTRVRRIEQGNRRTPRRAVQDTTSGEAWLPDVGSGEESREGTRRLSIVPHFRNMRLRKRLLQRFI